MGIDLFPDATLDVLPIWAVDGMQLTPPVVWQTLAEAWNAESGSGIDGRYNGATGEVEGKGSAKLQDTYKTGTAGRTGIDFTAAGGTWRDDWISPSTGKYGLLFSDGSSGASFDIHETSISTGMTHRQVVITRGMTATTVGSRTTAVNAYLELCYGSTVGNYRIAIEWGAPIRLEYQGPGSSLWVAVAIARSLGDAESYLEANKRQVRLLIKPDLRRNMLVVEVGDGCYLRHSMKREGSLTVVLPRYERYRLSGTNGVATLEVYPMRYQSPTVKKSARRMGIPVDVGRAVVFANGTSEAHADQALSGVVSQGADGGLEWEATAEMPDAGDGLGSDEPARMSDVTVWIPGVWAAPSLFVGWPYQPRVIHVREVQVWDDISRMCTAGAVVTMNNRYGDLTGVFGNYWARITATNGLTWSERMTGVLAGSPGLKLTRQDPVRIAHCTIRDPSYKLTVPLAQELILDGWCLYSAVRMLLELGQIHPKYQMQIPYYPYGPAGYDCPWPILGRGTGLHPKYRYGPEATPLGVLSELVQDAGVPDPVSGANVPFYMGFDRGGQFHFEPFDVRGLPVVKGYSDWDTGYGQIQHIEVENSIQDLRTELTFQGHDAYTNELMNLYIPMEWNLGAVGYRYPWVERNSRWASEEYLDRLARSAQVAASLPTQVIRMRVPFDPFVFAGQLIYVSEGNTLGRSGLFVITQLESCYGVTDQMGRSGAQECYSVITARAAEQYVPA